MGNILFSHIDDEQVIYYHCILSTLGSIRIAEETDCGVGKVHHCKLATDKQRDILFNRLQKSGYKYNPQTNKLEKVIEPTFKVGDKIEKCGYRFTIRQITDSEYIFQCGNKILIDRQDEFELVPNKFDITTLKPFDKVLVRDNYQNYWAANLYSHYMNANKDYHFATVFGYYKQCIPYNDETKHLLGKTEDCDNYYKTWE